MAQEAAAFKAEHPISPAEPQMADWNGGIGSHQLAWLRERLADANSSQEHVIVACHHQIGKGTPVSMHAHLHTTRCHVQKQLINSQDDPSMTALTSVQRGSAPVASAQHALIHLSYADNLACMHAIVLKRWHSAPQPRSSKSFLALPLVLRGVLCTCVPDSDEAGQLAGRCCS